jgi:hypothetical protein
LRKARALTQAALGGLAGVEQTRRSCAAVQGFGGERGVRQFQPPLRRTLPSRDMKSQTQLSGPLEQLNRRVRAELVFDCRLMIGDRLRVKVHRLRDFSDRPSLRE